MAKLENNLKILLLPKDVNDGKNVIMEIRTRQNKVYDLLSKLKPDCVGIGMECGKRTNGLF